jgi:acetoin utilization deacetylase AcuC-like enzyme
LRGPTPDGTIPGMRGPAAVIHSSRYRCDIGTHVFPMEKYDLVLRDLIASGDLRADAVLEPVPASDQELRLVHTAAYLDDLAALRWTPRTAGSEMPLTAEIVESYRRMAGGTVRAMQESLASGMAVHIGGGFHHAFADLASGFCYLNDLAIAVRVAQRDHGIERVAVVDVDLHQGNGTAHIFQEEPEVFTFSIHQERLYPIKERGSLDLGLDDGTGDDEYLRRLGHGLEHVWAHDPALVLVQAGADPYLDDQLGALKLSFEGLAARDRMVIDGCVKRGIPTVITLGGGYARQLSDLVRIHAQTCRIAIHAAREELSI